MSRYKRKLPECFGSFGDSNNCFGCDVRDECEEVTDEDAEGAD